MQVVTKEQQPRWNAIIIDLLREFIHICEQNNLQYYCVGGTAIGAVRHRGMIPWDDDIDVCMPRPDYTRFIEIASAINNPKLELVTPHNNEHYPLIFAKLCNRQTTLLEEPDKRDVYGLYIDIFPFDGAPDDVAYGQQLERRFRKLRNRFEAVASHTSFAAHMALLAKPKEWGRFVRKTVGFFCRKAYRRRLLAQIDACCARYDFDRAKNVIVYGGAYGPKEIFPKAWLGKGTPLTFEGMTVLLPSDYDAYLRHFFGDYMQLPPESERISHHQKAYFNLSERIPDAEVFRLLKQR